MDLILMLVLGLTSSLHCVTMCGPIIAVASAPLLGEGALARLLLWQAAYHLGRGMTYVAIGGVLGLLGSALSDLLATRLLGGVIQVAVGLTIAGLGVHQLFSGRAVAASPDRPVGALARLLRALVTSGHAPGMLALGLLSGFLPCGVLYAAFARSVAAHSGSEGALLMLAFWAGTVPLLWAVGLTAGLFFRLAGRHVPLLLCLAMLATGGWLGYKGVSNLMAPATAPAAASSCGHHHRP